MPTFTNSHLQRHAQGNMLDRFDILSIPDVVHYNITTVISSLITLMALYTTFWDV